jgi:hypothetical protein
MMWLKKPHAALPVRRIEGRAAGKGTYRLMGRISVRLRTFLSNTGACQNNRSPKVRQPSHNLVCWYFTQPRSTAVLRTKGLKSNWSWSANVTPEKVDNLTEPFPSISPISQNQRNKKDRAMTKGK